MTVYLYQLAFGLRKPKIAVYNVRAVGYGLRYSETKRPCTPMNPEPLALDIREAAKAAGICRAQIYIELRSGRLQARKCGRRTLIEVEEIHRWLRSLPTAYPEREAGQ